MSGQESKTPDPNQRLSAYLDGQLSAEERSAFEQQMRDNESLRKEVEIQKEIDASLTRKFTPPPLAADFLEKLKQPTNQEKTVRLPAPAAPRRQRLRQVGAVLAASLVWVAVGWYVFTQTAQDGYRQLALQDIYQQCVNEGFQPDWVCEDDHQFADTFQKRQGQALLLNPITSGEMVGLAYLRGLTSKTTAMLARVDGEPIIVFIDRLDKDPNPEKPSWWSGLHLFRKELEGLVIYEISPLTEPHVMDAFYPTQVPAPSIKEAN